MIDTKEKGKICLSGMGGFLNPPTHPEHTHSVQTDLKRKPENRSFMSLTSALNCEWLADSTKKEVENILDNWTRPDINTPEIQDWILQCLGYFGEGEGFLFIKKYYPEYQLLPEHVENKYWGKKNN